MYSFYFSISVTPSKISTFEKYIFHHYQPLEKWLFWKCLFSMPRHRKDRFWKVIIFMVSHFRIAVKIMPTCVKMILLKILSRNTFLGILLHGKCIFAELFPNFFHLCDPTFQFPSIVPVPFLKDVLCRYLWSAPWNT